MSRSCLYKCVNDIMTEAYITTLWRRGVLYLFHSHRSDDDDDDDDDCS